MKKIFAILAVAVAVFTGCKKTSDFNKYLPKDYEYVQSHYPGQEVVFYEAQLLLNGSPVELGMNAKPVSVKEVFQLTDSAVVVIVNRNYVSGVVELEIHDGYWCEDVVVDPTTIADYNKALQALLSAKTIEVPDAEFVTLRNPLGPVVHENPFYIFGSTHTNFVAVDAVTLEIQNFNGVEGYLKHNFSVEE